MYQGVKRALDFITALLALIVLSPLLAITALAVKLDSKGPAIFKQQRLGLHGKTFYIYKFRLSVNCFTALCGCQFPILMR